MGWEALSLIVDIWENSNFFGLIVNWIMISQKGAFDAPLSFVGLRAL